MIRLAFSKSGFAVFVRVAGALLTAAPAMAASQDQAFSVGSHPVIEPTAPSASRALDAALGRLARDPRNAEALLDAGNAALALGDNEAAVGFFNRADQVSPGNLRVKLAMAGARLHLDDPVEALRWYADAQRAGADPATFALDRGLAYALVGDPAAAVAEYRQALAHSIDPVAHDEAMRREAVSLAIGGDRRGADLALLPLLQRQDRAAWRAHVFVLAIAGRGDEAVGVTRETMPADLAAAIGPYLRFMVQLTPAQQAAVASLGHFPRAADIGRDDFRIVAYAASHPRVPLIPTAPPVQTLAQAQAQAGNARDGEARSARARRRKGHDAAPTLAAPAVMVAARDADLALPPPPPPVRFAAAPPVAPLASRSSAASRAGFDLGQVAGTRTGNPAASAAASAAIVPRPTVLSRLDMPPPPRRTIIAPAAAMPVVNSAPTRPVALAPAPTPVFMPAPVATPSAAVQPPIAPMVAAVVITPPLVSHPVVQPIPEPSPPLRTEPPAPVPASADLAKAAPIVPPPARAAPTRDKTALVLVSKDKPASDKPARGMAAHGKTETRAGKSLPADSADETPSSARDKAAKGKLPRGKAAPDNTADTQLAPCKPAAKAMIRKAGSATSKKERDRAERANPRHHGKGHADTADTETCAPTARGDRPDGPGGVSRTGDAEGDTRTAKGRSAEKAKGAEKATGAEMAKGAEKATGRGRNQLPGESDKTSTRGGRHARYASRIWVEVLTGADRDKMPGEWRNLVRKTHKLKGRKPYLTPWRSNYRLLTGPFDSDADAQDFIAELRKDGVSGFEWTSPAGQAVDSLPLP